MKDKQKAPLRKVVGHVMVSIGDDGETEYFQRQELLECGHAQPVRKDIYGETTAIKRRCKACDIVRRKHARLNSP